MKDMNEEYNKQYLLDCCNWIYDEAFDANSCYKIMRQMLQYHSDGYQGMNCSPVFYNTVYKAMYRATIMDLAKIYDVGGDTIHLKGIIDYCNKFADSIPKTITTVYPCSDGTYDVEGSMIQVVLTESDIRKLKKDGSIYHEVQEVKNRLEACGMRSSSSITLGVISKDYFCISGSRYKEIGHNIENLKKLRDKHYAHNDKQIGFNYQALLTEYPLFLDDIGDMILFALGFVINTIGLLTGELKAYEFYNVDDLSNTFQLVKLGKEYSKSISLSN